MPVTSRYIDPATGGYVVESGAPRGDPTVVSEVVLRLRTKRGSIKMKGLERFGSRLHLVTKNTPGVDARVVALVAEALADLVAAKRISNLETEVDTKSIKTALILRISFKDTTGATRTVPYTVTLAS